jgi:ribosomal protein S27AE
MNHNCPNCGQVLFIFNGKIDEQYDCNECGTTLQGERNE